MHRTAAREWLKNIKLNILPCPMLMNQLQATSGTLYKYIKAVESASQGCVTDA